MAFVVVSLVAFGVAYAAPIVSAIRLPAVTRVDPLPQIAIPAVGFPMLAVPKLRPAPAVPVHATAPAASPATSKRVTRHATRPAPAAPKRVKIPVLENSFGLPGKQAKSTTPVDPFAKVPVVSNDTGVAVSLPQDPAADSSAQATPPAAGTGNGTTAPPTAGGSDQSGASVPDQATEYSYRDHLTAASAPGADLSPATLTTEAASAALAQAISEWKVTVPDAKLGAVTIQVADLPGLELGDTSGNTITVDATAAGYGWSVMHPGDDTLRMDLLTVVRHELGHVLGYEHGDGLMAPTLAAGESRAVPAVPPAKEPAPAAATAASAGSSDASSSAATTGSSSATTSSSSDSATSASSGSSTTSSAPATSGSGSGSDSATATTGASASATPPADSAAAGTVTAPVATSTPTVQTSAAPTVAASGTWAVSLADGGSHDVSVAVVGDQVVVTVDGTSTSRPAADVKSVAITGGSGDDSFAVNGSLGSVAVSFDGGGGTDTVRGPPGDVTWSVTGSNSGSVGSVTFTRVQSLVGAAGNKDTFDVARGAGIDRVDGGAGGFDTISVIGDSVVSNPSGPQSGTLVVDGRPIAYAGLEPVSISAPNVTINGSDFGFNALSSNREVLDKDLIKIGPGSTPGTIEVGDFDPTGTVNYGTTFPLSETHNFTISGVQNVTINGGLGVDTVQFIGDYLVPNSNLTVIAEHIKVDPGVSICLGDTADPCHVAPTSNGALNFNAVDKDNGLSILGITTTIPVIGTDGLVDIGADEGAWDATNGLQPR